MKTSMQNKVVAYNHKNGNVYLGEPVSYRVGVPKLFIVLHSRFVSSYDTK